MTELLIFYGLLTVGVATGVAFSLYLFCKAKRAHSRRID